MNHTFTYPIRFNSLLIRWAIVASFLISLQLGAQTYTIDGSVMGGEAGNDRGFFPVRTSAFSNTPRCGYAQSIYPKTWLNAAGINGTANISALAWQVILTTGSPLLNGYMKIYIQQIPTTVNTILSTWDTTGTSYSAAVKPATLVYAGNVLLNSAAKDEWITFNFNRNGNSFVWDNNSNLLISVEYSGPNGFITWNSNWISSQPERTASSIGATCNPTLTLSTKRIPHMRVTVTTPEPLSIGNITAQQFTGNVTLGSTKQGILKIEVPTSGSIGTLTLNSLSVTSANTSNNDIAAGGVKLWAGNSLAAATQIGTGQNFNGSTATFTGLSQNITGNTLMWVTYDISPNGMLGNFVDAQIAPGGMVFSAAGGANNPGSQPMMSLNPAGNRKIDYCNDLYTNGCNNYGCDDVIIGAGGSVLNQLGTGCTGGTGFADYTSTILNMKAGQFYEFSITNTKKDFVFNASTLGVWIDFNQNGTYGDPGEFVGDATGTTVFADTITIPPGVQTGTYRMRIKLTENVTQNLSSACLKDNSGETHDYTVSIIGGLPTSINYQLVSNSGFSLYPNPARELVTLQTETPLHNATIRLIDLTGRVLLQQGGLSGNAINLNTSQVPSGIYQAELNQAGTLNHLKLIIH